MHYFTKVFAATVLVAALASAPAAPAWADDKSDCIRAKPDLAIAACDRLIKSGKLDPKALAVTYHRRGVAQRKKRQHDLAIADFTKALKLNPKYWQSYAARGATYENKKQYDLATADYTKIIELMPKLAHAYHTRGAAYSRNKQYDKAIADFTKEIELSPKYPAGYSAHEQKGSKDLALADYKKVLELRPRSRRAKSAVARLSK